MAGLEKYRKAAETGENEFSNFVNYAVKKKPEGKYKLHRILMIFGYIAFGLLYVTVCLVFTKLPMLIAVLPLLTWILVYFTWLWVNIEYEYMIIGGNLRMLEVYGSCYYRELCNVKISSFERIAPYSGEYADLADSADIAWRIDASSSLTNPDIYYGIYTESGERRVIFFEVAEKTLKLLKYYNPDVVMTKTRR